MESAFVGAPIKASTFTSKSTVKTSRCPARRRFVVKADLDLVPGVPSGQDVRDNAPLRHYVPRPAETYADRGFATKLPKNWAGEDFDSIGAADIPPMTKESLAESRRVQVDSAANSAFLEFANMMKDDRANSLARQAQRNSATYEGRATCGESEGKEIVSNYSEILVEGVLCTEYWGTPYGPVPRVFGGPGE